MWFLFYYFFCTMWNESKVNWALGRDPEIPSCSQAPLLSAPSALCPPFQYRVAWNLVSGDCAIPCCESHYWLEWMQDSGGRGWWWWWWWGDVGTHPRGFFCLSTMRILEEIWGGKQSSVSRWARGREEGHLLCEACVHLGGGRRSK